MDARGWQSGPCTGRGVVWAHVQIIEVVKVVHEGDASGSHVHGRGVFCREHLIIGTSVSSLYCVSDGMTAVGKVYDHPFVSALSLASFCCSSPSNQKTCVCGTLALGCSLLPPFSPAFLLVLCAAWSLS